MLIDLRCLFSLLRQRPTLIFYKDLKPTTLLTSKFVNLNLKFSEDNKFALKSDY